MCPRQLTEDGYELQFATNHLGHYLFTLLLLPRIIRSAQDSTQSSAPAKIINLSSLAHTWGDGRMHFEDINLEKGYSPTGAYGRSKLANILFTTELAKRLQGKWCGSDTAHENSIILYVIIAQHLLTQEVPTEESNQGMVNFIFK